MTGGNPGRHKIDDNHETSCPTIMQAIADTGYKGFAGQEFVPTGDPVEAMEQAYRTCDV